MYDIITCGSATVDVFAHTANYLKAIKQGKKIQNVLAYPLGSKILIESLQTTTGGGGTNTAVAFARLGLKTGYIGCVGNDINAITIIEMLKSEKITFLGTRSQTQSGYSVILDSIAHDRTILAFKGSNDELQLSKIPKAKAYYFSSMIGKSLAAQQKIAKSIRGEFLAFNPSLYQVKNGIKPIADILKKTTVLIFNKEEAQTLVNQSNTKQIFAKLHALGPKIVVITDGSKEVQASDGEKIYTLYPRQIPIMEATGAGDSFAAGFVYGLLKGKSISTSLRYGQQLAESVISYVGAKQGLLSKLTTNSAIKVEYE